MNRLILLLLCMGLFQACSDYSTFFDSDSSDSSTGGSMARFTVKGDYLYIVDDEHLLTFDISDSSKIDLKSCFDAAWGIETIFPTDTLLFLGSTSGMYIFSLKNPKKPSYISAYTHVTSCDPVVVQGDFAYVTLRSDNDNCWRSVNQLEVINISNINMPVSVATHEMVCPRGLAVSDTLLFICDGLDLVVMTISNPLNPIEKKRYDMDGTPYDVIAKDGILTISYSEGVSQYSYNGDTIQWISTVY